MVGILNVSSDVKLGKINWIVLRRWLALDRYPEYVKNATNIVSFIQDISKQNQIIIDGCIKDVIKLKIRIPN